MSVKNIVLRKSRRGCGVLIRWRAAVRGGTWDRAHRDILCVHENTMRHEPKGKLVRRVAHTHIATGPSVAGVGGSETQGIESNENSPGS